MCFYKENQKAILYTLVSEFNEMMIQLTTFNGMKNVFNIDWRVVTRGEEDWFDELHLKSEGFEVVAKTYKACIDENIDNEAPVKKVYVAKDYR